MCMLQREAGASPRSQRLNWVFRNEEEATRLTNGKGVRERKPPGLMGSRWSPQGAGNDRTQSWKGKEAPDWGGIKMTSGRSFIHKSRGGGGGHQEPPRAGEAQEETCL